MTSTTYKILQAYKSKASKVKNRSCIWQRSTRSCRSDCKFLGCICMGVSAMTEWLVAGLKSPSFRTSHSRLLSGRQGVSQRLQQKPRRFELKLNRRNRNTTFRPGAESHVQCAVYLVGCMPFSISQAISQRLAPESAQSPPTSFQRNLCKAFQVFFCHPLLRVLGFELLDQVTSYV